MIYKNLSASRFSFDFTLIIYLVRYICSSIRNPRMRFCFILSLIYIYFTTPVSISFSKYEKTYTAPS